MQASFVCEDEYCISFLDIHPIAKAHVLVVPKVHVERFTHLEVSVAGHLFQVAHKIVKAMERSDLSIDGTNLFLSDGVVAGQEVMHPHLHIVPRFQGDGLRMQFSKMEPKSASRAHLDECAARIRNFIV